MKQAVLLAYKRAYRLLCLVLFLLLGFRAEASLVAGTDFAPFVYPGDSIIWTLSDVQHYGVSGHTMRSKAEYSIDSRLFRDNETSHFAYCVTKNPSTLSKRYLENDEYVCVVQFAGEMEANTSFFSYRAQGLRPGTQFTVTLEYYLLNMVSEAMDLFGAEETPSVQFRACLNPDENGENATYGADGAVDVSTAEYQKKQAITLKGTYSADDPYLELNLLFAETGKAKGIAIGISNIKVEGTFDPHIYSSQGVEACENEQTLLTLDREYNVGDDEYSWQIFENGQWTEFSTAKNVMYNMEKNSVFRCVVAGVESNVLEVETIPCCQIEGKEASRKVLLWETFGHFKNEHTYVDSKGVESTTPAAWPNYRADVSYDLQGSRFDDGSGYICPECTRAQSGEVHDGLYAIVVPSPTGFDGAGGKKVTWFKGVTSDHTSLVTGESNGGALFINVEENYTGPVFEAEFNDVCAGTQIFYEFWVANFSNNQYDPLVSFVLTDDKGEVLDEKENVVVKAKSGWTSISGKFLLDGEGTRNVKMQVLSVCGDYCTDAKYWREGNDLILDDIKFMVCSPPSLELYTDISEFTKDMKICSPTSFSLSSPASALLTTFYGEPNFLFQYSLDGGETWDNLSDIQDDSFMDEMNTSDAIFNNAEKMMFRVLSASKEVLNEFYLNPNSAQYGDNCRSYSVSEPVTIVMENAVDFGETYYGSFCEGDEVKLTAPTTNVDLAYWGWKDENGELPGATLGDDESILTFVVTQHKSSEREVFTFTAYTSEGCQGIRNYVIDVREPVVFELDELRACGETRLVINESTPADAEFVWNYNGVISSGREFIYSEADYVAAGNTTQHVIVTATGHGYCRDGNAYELKFNPIPAAALSTRQVSYLRAEADANGNFTANLMAQSNNDAISGYDASMQLVWFERDCETPIGDGLTAPTPQVDVTGEMGKDQYFYYCVKQSVNGCLSPGAEVEVVVNGAPKPNSNEYTYCRGEKAVAITTTPDIHIKPDAVYQLKWYGNGEEGDYTDFNLVGSEGPIPPTTIRSGEVGKSEYYYYVTQTEVIDGNLGVESNKTAIKVVVYDKPIIKVDPALLQPVCKPTTVDLSRAVSLANAMSLNYQYTYYQDTSLKLPLANATVSVGGAYAVVAQFSVPDKNSTEPLTCVSVPVSIPVTVDTLSVAVANVTSCPDMEATFSVVAQTNALGGATYKWRGLTEVDSTQSFVASSTFTTKKFVGAENGDSYLYSLQVAAGACFYRTDTMKVTMNDAPVVGTLSITESGVSESKLFSNATEIEFYSCGGPLKVVAGYLDRVGNPITDYVWYEGNVELAKGAELVLPANETTADKQYLLTFTNGCPATVSVNVMVDAMLRMTTSLKDTVCSGDSVVMTIDTTGTGLMRHDDWSRYLNVKATSNGSTADLTSKIVLKGNLLELAVAPLNSTTYEIHFHYGNQDTVANESVVVVPSGTNVVVSDPVKICAGDTAQIELSGIDPNYSVVKWKEDGTILTSDLSSTTIQVVPDYQGINHSTFKAYYEFEIENRYCQASRIDSAYVLVDEPLVGEITGDSVFCEGFSTRLDASSYGASSYLWSKAGVIIGNGTFITEKPSRTTTYQLVMTRGKCRSEENYQVTVNSKPKILYLDSSDTKSRTVVLESGKGEAPFSYWLDENENDKQFSSLFSDLPYRHHIMHVEDANGCVDQYGFTVVIPNFTVPAFFSPNGDGVRDRWVLEDLSFFYPDAEVFIYDRLGKLLAKFTGADEDGWDGTYNGHAMPSTDYWYVIVVKSVDREFKGHFTLIREK